MPEARPRFDRSSLHMHADQRECVLGAVQDLSEHRGGNLMRVRFAVFDVDAERRLPGRHEGIMRANGDGGQGLLLPWSAGA